MDSRREFIKKAAMIAGATGLAGILPSSIQKAMAIDPAPGSTWLDAEHVVILMQENRSFDHAYGTLKGVRGYRDPRAITLPNGNPVWLQSNAKGETFAPFRLDIKDTRATWMGSLPHSFTNQTDARNDGRFDQWLQSKRSSTPAYAQMPLTLGYYDRRDLPFYYAFADAFTICDQNFCSSLTGTTPNRLHLWTGTIREDVHSRARIRNEDCDYPSEAAWTTFPERLEDHDIDWRIYQNEIGIHPGFKDEEDAWLSNFTDNPIEWFSQFRVRFSPSYMSFLPAAIQQLEHEIADMKGKQLNAHEQGQLAEKEAMLAAMKKDQTLYTPEKYAQLSERDKALHTKAFTVNQGDPAFRELTDLTYQDGEHSRQMQAPKGDVLHQFREDVKSGKLPTVSWLVSPERFSDHPSSPWYGAWYISEVLDILTQNPEVWKKTIFILCYDENDGYYDHIPPFVAPDPTRPETGFTSEQIDTAIEYHTLEMDKVKETDEARGGPIGLGFRVPLVIASPWSRGGYVNSQVSDHTSILQLLEKWLSHKTGQEIKETNISTWRRTVCGDLSTVFRPFHASKAGMPAALSRKEELERINKAQYRGLPTGYKALTEDEIGQMRRDVAASPLMPVQEKGVRPSCALPYELYADGHLTTDATGFHVSMRVGDEFFGNRTAGAPFMIYTYGKEMKVRHYAIVPGGQLSDTFPMDAFEGGRYDIRVYGPNGFFRKFTGVAGVSPAIKAELDYERNGEKPTGRVLLRLVNTDTTKRYTIQVKDNSYGTTSRMTPVEAEPVVITLDPGKQGGWYDHSVVIQDVPGYEQCFAGRVETGKDSISDPAIG